MVVVGNHLKGFCESDVSSFELVRDVPNHKYIEPSLHCSKNRS
jgi:hypothetical protein